MPEIGPTIEIILVILFPGMDFNTWLSNIKYNNFQSKKMTKIFIFLVFFIYVGNIYAQHTEHHSVSPKNKAKELTFKGVLEAQLSDDILKDYSMQSTLMTVPAGFVDSVAHRHDADLFGYVIKGKIVVALEGEGAKTYMAGQMFHETRNILHTRLENLNSKATAEVLLIFIIKKGASSYIKE